MKTSLSCRFCFVHLIIGFVLCLSLSFFLSSLSPLQEISARDAECLALRSALLHEQSSTTNLESVVATSREREFVEQLEKEKTKEILEEKLKKLAQVNETL